MLGSCFSEEACILGISTFQKYHRHQITKRTVSLSRHIYIQCIFHTMPEAAEVQAHVPPSQKTPAKGLEVASLLHPALLLWGSFPFYTAAI